MDQAAYIRKLERRIHNQRKQLAWYQATWRMWCRNYFWRSLAYNPGDRAFIARHRRREKTSHDG